MRDCFEDMEFSVCERMMNVNCTSHIAVTKAVRLAQGRLTVDELLQGQEEDLGIGPILSLYKSSKTRPPWSAVTALSPAAKAYWGQWDRLHMQEWAEKFDLVDASAVAGRGKYIIYMREAERKIGSLPPIA